MQTNDKYSLITRLLHWLSAIIVFTLLTLGIWMVDLSYYDEWYTAAPDLHKSIGILFSFILIGRLFNTFIYLNHLSKNDVTPLQTVIAKFIHGLMYLILFTLIITGFLISTANGKGIMVFSLFELPSIISFGEDQAEISGLLHEYIAYSLIALILIHATAALHHHFILKNNVLKRIL
ncbi:cytochrome b [Algibacillus agarilyticus]|uniref:cytochrome b n=1 Tax=Algibacillus agarilyticus TaxID=2234133 RepID=UPI000DD031B1|nr:cytochrome b [Algibacillus agarilyticus]